jgi:hypothetical protein
VLSFLSREKLYSMNLLLYMAPISVLLLLPATIFMEDNVVGITIQLAKKDFTIVWLLLFNSYSTGMICCLTHNYTIQQKSILD